MSPLSTKRVAADVLLEYSLSSASRRGLGSGGTSRAAGWRAWTEGSQRGQSGLGRAMRPPSEVQKLGPLEFYGAKRRASWRFAAVALVAVFLGGLAITVTEQRDWGELD